MKIITVYKNIIENIPDLLIVDPDADPIVGKIRDVFIEVVDQNEQLPNVLLEFPEQGQDYTHSGPVGVFDGHLKVTTRANSAKEASEIGEEIQDVLEVWKGTLYDRKVMLTENFKGNMEFNKDTEIYEHTSEYTSYYRKVTP